MAECECLAGCSFYHDKMPIDSGVGKMFKAKYCLGDNAQCARHNVFKKFGSGTVPKNLYPNMHDRAEKIISGAEAHA
jgi:hypothetical protein